MKKILFAFIFALCVTTSVYAVSPPMIYETTCNNVVIEWHDPPEPPDISPYAGTLYFQEEGSYTQFMTLKFKTHSGQTWYYEIAPEQGFDGFKSRTWYRLNAFIKGGNSGGIYWVGNGDTWWMPCRKIMIRLPVVTKGW